MLFTMPLHSCLLIRTATFRPSARPLRLLHHPPGLTCRWWGRGRNRRRTRINASARQSNTKKIWFVYRFLFLLPPHAPPSSLPSMHGGSTHSHPSHSPVPSAFSRHAIANEQHCQLRTCLSRKTEQTNPLEPCVYALFSLSALFSFPRLIPSVILDIY